MSCTDSMIRSLFQMELVTINTAEIIFSGTSDHIAEMSCLLRSINKLAHLLGHCHCLRPASWHSEPGLHTKWPSFPHPILQAHFSPLASILNCLIIVLNPLDRNWFFLIHFHSHLSSSPTESYFAGGWICLAKETLFTSLLYK